MKLYKYTFPLLLGIAIGFGIFLGSKLNFDDSTNGVFAKNSKKDKLNRLIDYIEHDYVDNINTDSIVDVTVNGILENLDPHSVYIPSDIYQENADDMRGNFVGIGISFYPYRDSITVIRAIKGGPAYKAGIKGGDRILYADNKKLFGDSFNRDSISKFLKGEINTKVKLKVFRKEEQKTLDFIVKRKEVPIVSVEATYMVNENLGYIKLNRFAESTPDEFNQALNSLLNHNMKTLILDLRNNPGGYITSAESVVDEFLNKKDLIVITKDKNGEETKSYATRKGDFENGKVYILINENSASASEIVAGAMQDNDKGIIVGRRSFGKGLVQREMALGDGSAVRLTIARYYTPSGRSIQRSYKDGLESYYNDYEERYKNGELVNSDNIKIQDTLKFRTKKGKVVYGGGGIIPDVFVPKNLSIEHQTLQYILNGGFMSYFIFEYLEENRSNFNNLSFADFQKDFTVNEKLKQDFLAYASLQNNFSLKNHNTLLKKAIKASLAEQLYGTNAFEKILNQDDKMIQKILQLETEKVIPKN